MALPFIPVNPFKYFPSIHLWPVLTRYLVVAFTGVSARHDFDAPGGWSTMVCMLPSAADWCGLSRRDPLPSYPVLSRNNVPVACMVSRYRHSRFRLQSNIELYSWFEILPSTGHANRHEGTTLRSLLMQFANTLEHSTGIRER